MVELIALYHTPFLTNFEWAPRFSHGVRRFSSKTMLLFATFYLLAALYLIAAFVDNSASLRDTVFI